MDDHKEFNRTKIKDRQIDTLIGISKGLLADRRLCYEEVEFLHSWLLQNSGSKEPMMAILQAKVASIVDDGALNEVKATELYMLLECFNGVATEVGEVAKPTSLPLSSLDFEIDLSGKRVVVTGTFAMGSRTECKALIERLGGVVHGSVSGKTDYLIIGDYVSDSWAHETYGRKIEAALEVQSKGSGVKIISERMWLDSLGW